MNSICLHNIKMCSEHLRNAWSPLKGYSLHLVLGTLASAGSLYLMTTPCGNVEIWKGIIYTYVCGRQGIEGNTITFTLHKYTLLTHRNFNQVNLQTGSTSEPV